MHYSGAIVIRTTCLSSPATMLLYLSVKMPFWNIPANLLRLDSWCCTLQACIHFTFSSLIRMPLVLLRFPLSVVVLGRRHRILLFRSVGLLLGMLSIIPLLSLFLGPPPLSNLCYGSFLVFSLRSIHIIVLLMPGSCWRFSITCWVQVFVGQLLSMFRVLQHS